jgi:hypothetical protein
MQLGIHLENTTREDETAQKAIRDTGNTNGDMRQLYNDELRKFQG